MINDSASVTTDKKNPAATNLDRIALASESASSVSGYIDNIQSVISKTTGLFQSNNIVEANKMFIELTEMLELTVTITTKILNVCNTADEQATLDIIEKYNRCETHLMSILKEILAAHKDNNISLICDLLEYELKDNLVKWHSDCITPMARVLSVVRHTA